GGPDRIPVFGKLPGDFVLTFAGGRIRVLVPVGSLFLLAFLISLFSRRWR
ncbi:MAG: DUF2905 family protein, partial [Lentisphaerae bacterium]|nr:DUF2905 family protein [Lentisphaerota bacterium]